LFEEEEENLLGFS